MLTAYDFWIDSSLIYTGSVCDLNIIKVGKYFGDVILSKTVQLELLQIEDYLKELQLLKNVRNVSLIQHIGAWVESKNLLHVVTEYCGGGDLSTLLKSQNELGWKIRVQMMKEITTGIEYLHEHNLIHKNLSCFSILLTTDWHCKIAYFGLNTLILSSTTSTFTTKNLSNSNDTVYLAPELIHCLDYTNAVDIFSIGVVILEIMTRQRPTSIPQKENMFDALTIYSQIFDEKPYVSTLTDMAFECVSFDSFRRPTATKLLSDLSQLHRELPPDSFTLPEASNVPEEYFMNPKFVLEGSLTDKYQRILDADDLKRCIEETIRQQLGDTVQILKVGYLWKRNRSGFLNWKARLIVLTSVQLLVYTSHVDMVDGRRTSTTMNALETIPFSRSKISIRSINTNQFQVIQLLPMNNSIPSPTSTSNNINGSKKTKEELLKKIYEFAAESEEVLQLWKVSITQAIENCPMNILDDNSNSNTTLVTSSRRSIRSTRLSAIILDDPEKRLGFFRSAIGRRRVSTDSSDNMNIPNRDSWLATTASKNTTSPEARLSSKDTSTIASTVRVTKEDLLPVMRISHFTSVQEWLRALQLESYIEIFEQFEYTSLDMIKDFGLNSCDLDYMNIKNPLHRRVLMTTSAPVYAISLEVTIPDWKIFGSVVIYRIVSRWRNYTSEVWYRLSDFSKLHSIIKREISHHQENNTTKILSSLPILPGKGISFTDSRDKNSLTLRRDALELYLQSLATLLKDSMVLYTLLSEFELVSRAVADEESLSTQPVLPTGAVLQTFTVSHSY